MIQYRNAVLWTCNAHNALMTILGEHNCVKDTTEYSDIKTGPGRQADQVYITAGGRSINTNTSPDMTEAPFIISAHFHTNNSKNKQKKRSANLSATMAAFIIKNPINPSETLRVHDQIQICSDASEKNLTSLQISWRDFYKPRPWGMWRQRSNSQFQMANDFFWQM